MLPKRFLSLCLSAAATMVVCRLLTANAAVAQTPADSYLVHWEVQVRSAPFLFHAEAPDSVVVVGGVAGPANLLRAAPPPITAPVALTAPATGVTSRQAVLQGTFD